MKGINMKNIVRINLSLCLLFSFTVADELKVVDNLQDMFKDGKVSGQIRIGYKDNHAAEESIKDTYATAIGGQLKFESASLNGISFGVAGYTSHTIHALSGDGDKFNDALSSYEKSYTELAEAYINYSYDNFNFRAGRQVLDTPLADSDDVAMTPHTFEAYVASYTFKDLGVTLIGANIQKWQGIDSEYENVLLNSWQDTGDNGTWMAAALYNNDFIESGVWYYDVEKSAKAVYADITGTIVFNEDVSLMIGAQVLNENESSNSNIDGSIVGAMAELAFFDATASLVYDRVNVNDTKQIFEGFGGGSSYTNMDTMTAGTLHDGTYGDGSSYVASLGYNIANINLFALYGDFKADAIGVGQKAHVTELDIGATYEYNDGEADITIVYVDGKDKESALKTSYDDSHIQITANYNF